MFGKNEVSSKFQYASGSLLVNSVFYTIQGEGPDAGRPAVFVRLSKCNLRCFFCDTEFESGTVHSLAMLWSKVNALIEEHNCNLVVITGGEPLLQNIIPFVEKCNLAGVGVSVETAGTTYLDGLQERFDLVGHPNNLIVISPKTPGINKDVLAVAGALKYIVRVGEVDPTDGLPNKSTQKEGEAARIFRPPLDFFRPVYIQPCDEYDAEKNEANAVLAGELCMKHGYRLSVQMHKVCKLP